jgi:hypothetical protein
VAEHWRDQHRAAGRFKPRPGAKGFAPNPERAKAPPTERKPFALWVEKVESGDAPEPSRGKP